MKHMRDKPEFVEPDLAQALKAQESLNEAVAKIEEARDGG